MGAVMDAHINEFLRFGSAAESGFADVCGRSDKGDDRPVGGFTGIYVQHFDAFHRGDGRYNLVNYGAVAAFAIIGDTFNQLFHIRFLSFIIVSKRLLQWVKIRIIS